MFMCTPLPSIWKTHHERSHHKHCNHQEQNSHKSNIKVCFSRVRRHTVSQSSIATVSIKDCVEVTRGEVVKSIATEGASAKPLDTEELYQPMTYDNSIRLLCLHKGTSSDPVEITLEFARLDDTIQAYEALSYVWGTSVTASHIIDKKTQTPVSVTRNLYDALKGVRQTEQDCVMWVDALCINQGDGKEKGTQVCRMNAIYTYASRVVVWLGPDSAGDAYGAFGVLCSLANTECGGSHYETISESCAPSVPNQVADIRDYEAWRKVVRFFCQPWFTRLWVLQEIVLAQDALFVWGECSISWDYVGAAIDMIYKTDLIRHLLQTRSLQNAFLMWHLSLICRNARAATVDQQSHQSGLFPFLHLLDTARGFEVTNPRDKIYGLLGFPTLCDDLCPDAIIPNYALSVAQVYTNVSHNYIKTNQNLDILALVATTQDMEPINALPSWVPNFNSIVTAAPISSINAGQQYTAGLSRPLHLSPSTNPHLLRLEGAVLDTIRKVGPSIPLTQAHQTKQYLEPLIRWYTNAGATAADLTALLTGGRDREGRLLSPRQKENCAAFLSTTMEDPGLELSTTSLRAGLPWQDIIHRFTTYHQPFLTATGKLGLGPHGLEEGDVLAVLWGGQCPFIISPANCHQWILKGECYIAAWVNRDTVAELVGSEGIEGVAFEFV